MKTAIGWLAKKVSVFHDYVHANMEDVEQPMFAHALVYTAMGVTL